ncbi:MAG: DUF5317 family protein, partial [Acidimicrobiales bacterium]
LSGAGTMLALGLGALLAFGAANLQLTGVPVVILGIALNLVPLAFNGTVPVSEAGAVTVDLGTFETISETDLGATRTLENSTQRFIFLGDIIPIKPLGQVYSFGDLIIAFGLANMMYRILKPRRNKFKDEQAGWPESTVPTEDVSSDPWTAMLRGEIDDDDFAAKTGPQPSVTAVAPEPTDWEQDPPVDTGPMMIMGQPDATPPAAEPSQPDPLDLSLTWADEPAPDAAPAPEPSSAPPSPQAPQSEAASPFAPPSESVAEQVPPPEPPAPVTQPPAPVTQPPAPVTQPPAPVTQPPAPVSQPPAAVEPSAAPEPPPASAETPATTPEGRSFAPELPDMHEKDSVESAFAAALAAFDDERSDYGHETDSQPAAEDSPEHDTGPMPVVEKPTDDS